MKWLVIMRVPGQEGIYKDYVQADSSDFDEDDNLILTSGSDTVARFHRDCWLSCNKVEEQSK